MTLVPGYYKLSRDVQNPQPDRRKTREITAQPVWWAGTRIAVISRPNERYIGDAVTKPNADHLEIEFADDRHAILTRRMEWDEVYKAIVPALEPIEMDLDLTLHKVSLDSWTILDRLVRSGRVTLSQVEEAADEVKAEYEAQDPKVPA